jgi:hypothetical protein
MQAKKTLVLGLLALSVPCIAGDLVDCREWNMFWLAARERDREKREGK